MSLPELYLHKETGDMFPDLWGPLTNLLGRFAPLAYPLSREFNRIAKKRGTQKGSDWVHDYINKKVMLPIKPLSIISSDMAVKDAAEAMAKKCLDGLAKHTAQDKQNNINGADRVLSAFEFGNGVAQEFGVDFPCNAKLEKDKAAVVAAWARMSCAKWWRRKIRVMVARGLEDVARELGMTNAKRGLYVSRLTAERRAGQKERNKNLLKKVQATNEEGQSYTLEELAELSTSNPVNRRNELMVRMRGFEEWAETQLCSNKYQAIMLTATTPSRFHAFGESGWCNFRNWSGETVRDGQAWLCRKWANIRAAADREGLKFYGFRVAEPHHDGTPHWHIVLWVERSAVSRLWRVFEDEMLCDDFIDDESGAKACRMLTPKRREKACKLDIIKPYYTKADDETGARYCPFPKPSAVGYVAKYVCKNIDGLKPDGTEYSEGAIKKALAVEAWASTHGIRQFQQIGGPSVSVYRELRRVDSAQIAQLPPKAVEIVSAADAGEWCQYTELMGGGVARRVDRPMGLWLRKKMEEGKEAVNQYGEKIMKLTGLLFGSPLEYLRTIETRLRVWTVGPVVNEEKGFKVGAENIRFAEKVSRLGRSALAERALSLRAAPPRYLDLCQ